MPLIQIAYKPPTHGWLSLSLTLETTTIEVDASDVPNNPIQELFAALDAAAHGTASSVWWHLEPAGYFMYFDPVGSDVRLRVDFTENSEPDQARNVATVQGSRKQVLYPLWRFLREFQSHGYQDPHWPEVNYDRIQEIKAKLEVDSEA